MKKIYLLTKTLLVATLLMVGANAWAGTRTITYDFKTAAASGGITESSLTKGSSAGTNNGTTIYYPTELTSELGNRFAFQYREKNSYTNVWAVEKSRNGLWVNCASGVDDYFSILNLKEGDKITITIATGKIKFSATVNAKTSEDVTPDAWSYVTSDEEYTIKADGQLDLQAMKYNNGGNAHMAISKLVIVTSDDEVIETAPSVAVTGANGGNRTVTITGYNTSADNATKTYYTLDGTTPTSSSNLYSTPFTVSTSDDTDSDGTVVVKAISYKDGDTSIESGVTTLNVTGVGTTLTLNAPTISVSNLVANGGVYNATYSFASDQSGILGSPTATISYTFAGGSSTEGTSYTPTTAGQLIVTASASGYTSKSTTVNILPNYIRTYYADFSTLVREDASGYSNYQINNAGCSFYSYTNTFDELTLTGFSLAWAITNAKVVGLHARGGAGTITYDESFVAGSIIDFSCANTTSAYHVYSTTATTTIPQYVGVYNMSIYSPTISTTISAVDYSTLASDYDLDFSVLSSTLKAYKATVSGSTITFTSVNTVPAGEGVLLKSVEDLDANTVFNIPVTTGVAAWDADDNAFVRGTGAAVATGTGPYNYVLSTKGGVVGFYQAAGLTVPDNKCYLQSATNAARITLDFADDSEVTGINAVNDEGLTVNGSVYDLQGRCVAQPKKGLYIMNGRKVVIK